MLGQWIDECPVLARLHHMGAGIPADGTCSDDSYLPAHAFLPAFLAAEASALAGLIATVETHRARRQALFVSKSPFVHLSADSCNAAIDSFIRRQSASEMNVADHLRAPGVADSEDLLP